MKNHRRLIFRLGAIVIILAVAACMFVIGRGYTVYFDSKSGEYNGKAYESPYKIEVLVDGEKVAKLYDGERGMADTMGQDFNMRLEITKEKGGEKQAVNVGLKLPYRMDGVVLNLPAMLAGLPEEAYLSEFVIEVPDTGATDEEIVTDEFDMGGDL